MKKKTIRKILIIVLALVFLGSSGMLLKHELERREAADIYAQAQQMAVSTPTPAQTPPPTQSPQPEHTPEPSPEQTTEPDPEQTPLPVKPSRPPEEEEVLPRVDLDALRGVSGDVIGWIEIPGTGLAYPLMQGEDNDYYLNHSWNGRRVAAGSIFMECQCAADFTDFNTIIYGHRMTYDAMFAYLKYYKNLSYWQAHPLVYIVEQGGTRCYEIFAAYEASVKSCVYWLKVTDDAHKQAVIDFALEHSVIDTGVIPQTTDRILTLSTCTESGHATRWVVQAVERQKN